ncbi:Ku protein [Streptomyces coffeae]|uniref:Ku domain-containing protein n=1 Tax=Streptomyces coffeae TaxID=621382 RepID=A0ABS1NPX4_9ACTN|nr:hypothetical protein [Streptomyces coffeae]
MRHRRVCELENVEVPQDQIARAWEAPGGRQVILRDTGLEALPLATKHVIEVLGYVGTDEVDPILYLTPYWVSASGAGAQRPYALLVEALSRSGRLAVCKVARYAWTPWPLSTAGGIPAASRRTFCGRSG